MKRALLICASGFYIDIHQQYELLVNKFGYKPNEILVVGRDLGVSALRDTLARSGWYDQIWIYYSGHGMQNGALEGGFTLDMLCDQIARIRGSQVLMVMDCCYSGKVGAAIARACSTNPHVTVLCSSMPDERSHNVLEKASGVERGAFTVSFLGCLRRLEEETGIMDLYDSICREFLEFGVMDQSPMLVRSSANSQFRLYPIGKLPDVHGMIRRAFSRNRGYR